MSTFNKHIDDIIDPTIEKSEREYSTIHESVAEENLQQQLIEQKKYEDTMRIRMLASRTLEDIFLNATSMYGEPLPNMKNKTANIYYGAMASIDNGINIVSVGDTPMKAIEEYTTYLEEFHSTSPFKLYPISYSLYTAIACRTAYKKSLGLTPKSWLVDQSIVDPDTKSPIHVDPYIADGMVDLYKRKYLYPSVRALTHFGSTILSQLLLSEINDTPDTIDIDLCYQSTNKLLRISVVNNIVTYFDEKDISISENVANDILFKYYYGWCTAIFNQTYSGGFTTMSYRDFLQCYKHEQIFIMSMSCKKNDVHKNVCCNFIFPHADMCPKIDICI